ncbi:NFACT family protein [Candidatus Woesearchaeota archaeon]|nr:NFACT family protein [Candidatus Woesearchaeota archaeon]
MKYQITAMDMHFLLRELKERLIRAKADKIFQPEKKDFIIRFHATGIGKQIMRINLPGYMFLTDFKGEMPEAPGGFCMMLRKYLTGSRLADIRQPGFERVLELVFETKQGIYRLIIEFFSIGNMIFTDEDYNIKSVLEAKRWKDRTLRGNVCYEFPKKRLNPFELSNDDFRVCIKGSEKESIVKSLAMDLGIGGSYSEEICMRAGIEKDKKNLADEEIDALYAEIKNLADEEIDANVIYEDNLPAIILPVRFKTRRDGVVKSFSSFNEALDSILTREAHMHEQEKRLAPYKKELERLNRQIEQQKNQISEYKESADENQKKGELIYQKYAVVDEIISTINNARKKHSFKEIKEKLKGHKVVKEINEKDKTVSVEL